LPLFLPYFYTERKLDSDGESSEDDDEDEGPISTYIASFNKLNKKTSPFALKNDNIDSLAYSKLHVRCFIVKEETGWG
jgi:hypothetical protein